MMGWMRGRSRSTTRGVKALVNRPRIRVWSGGSAGRAWSAAGARARRGCRTRDCEKALERRARPKRWSRSDRDAVLVAREHPEAERALVHWIGLPQAMVVRERVGIEPRQERVEQDLG